MGIKYYYYIISEWQYEIARTTQKFTWKFWPAVDITPAENEREITSGPFY